MPDNTYPDEIKRLMTLPAKQHSAILAILRSLLEIVNPLPRPDEVPAPLRQAPEHAGDQ